MSAAPNHPLHILGGVESSAFRLPSYERLPRHYRLDIEPPAPSKTSGSSGSTPLARPRRGRLASRDEGGSQSASTFIGRCSITFEVVTPVASELAARFVVLHTLELAFATEDVVVEVLPNNTHTNATRDLPTSAQPLPGTPSASSSLPVIACVSQMQWSASETTSLEFAAPLPNKRGDRFCLHLRQYTGRIHTRSKGLYRSYPDDPLFLTTHLEPANARRLLPCYDEPAFLSVFELSVVTEVGYTAVSNTPFLRAEPLSADGEDSEINTIISSASSATTIAGGRRRETDPVLPGLPEGGPASAPRRVTSGNATSAGATNTNTTTASGACTNATQSENERATPLQAFVIRVETATRRRCFFEPTPTLHACIIGFTIGRYTIAERFSKRRGIPCRVVIPESDPLHSAWFALDLLIKALDFFDAFFDYELPLRKVDLVALDNFDSLGMENWGMIVLAKSHMLVNESTTIERRQRITRLIGHEVCHHWFGDWAAIQWWDDLWLKEGVCRYLEYFFVDSVAPSWCIWTEFVGSIMEDAIVADADAHRTHPVRYCRDGPREIEESFDHISYGKGAAVLRMLFSMLTDAQMQKAFHLVLVRYGASAFGLEEFQECVEDAIRPCTRRQRRAMPASNHDATALPRSLPHSPTSPTGTATATTATTTTFDAEDEDSRQIRMVQQVLQMVHIAGHPYLLVRDTAASTSTASTASTTATASPLTASPVSEPLPRIVYTITQHGTTRLMRDTLAAYVHHRQRQRGVIDLLTPPVDEFFGWDPLKVLPAASPPLCVPLRVMELQSRLGICLPPRLESLTGDTTVCRQPRLSRAASSPFTLALSAERPTTSTSGHASAADVDAAGLPVMSPCSATTPCAGTGAFLSYFNVGGAAMLTCDYDSVTWRRLIEAVPYLSDEDRMSLTVTLARLRPLHIGHLDGESSTTERCTLFPEWLLALTQSPRLMTSFLWNVVTARLETLLFLTQNSYCNAGLCELVENVFAPLHQRCLLSFFAREKSIVDGFEARVHLSFQTVMNILFVMALCHKPDYRDEALEIHRWVFQELFVGAGGGGGGTATVSDNSSFAAADGSLVNSNTNNNNNNTGSRYDDGSSAPGSDASPPLGAGLSGSSATPSPFAEGSGSGYANDAYMAGMANSVAHNNNNNNATATASAQAASRSMPQGIGSRPSTDGVFFSSLVASPHRVGSTTTLLSPFTSSATLGLGGRDDLSGARPPPAMAAAGRAHWLEETCINLKRSAHISVIQTALFYLIELGDISVWVDAVAIVAHRLQCDVGALEEAIGMPVPTLATVTDHAQRERSTELLADLSMVLVPLIFALDDERAFPFMAFVLDRFSMLDALSVRLIFRNTRFLTFLLTKRLIKELRLLRHMLHIGSTLCSNGTIIALLKINLAALYSGPRQTGSTATDPDTSGTRDMVDDAAADASTAALGTNTLTASLDSALVREIHECRQLEFCGPVAEATTHASADSLEVEEEEDALPHDALAGTHHIDCGEAARNRAIGKGSPVARAPSLTVRPTTAGPHAHRRRRNLPEEIVALLDAMEANCVWVDYCCEHFDRFIREARERYGSWVTSSASVAPSSCLTPLTSEPHARGEHHDGDHANFGGVSI